MTNIISITNVVNLTNTITKTNILDKIDIMTIPTDWNVLRVTILGAGFTLISAIVMWHSVQEMRRQNNTLYSQNMIEKIDAITQTYFDHLNNSEESKKIFSHSPQELKDKYNFIVFLAKERDEFEETMYSLNQLKYIIKLNRNKKQIEYFNKLYKEIFDFIDLLCEFCVVFTGNISKFADLKIDQKKELENLERPPLRLLYHIILYHKFLWLLLCGIPIEDYQEIDRIFEDYLKFKNILEKIITEKKEETK